MNAKGALASITSTSESDGLKESYTYDEKARLNSETRTYKGQSFTYSYEYDSKSRTSKMNYPEGFAVTYGYTDYDDLTSIKNAADNTTIWKHDGTVNSWGQMLNATYGNGKQITYGYDSNNLPWHIYVPNVLDFTYSFDATRPNLKYRDEKFMNSSSVWYGVREDFTYDKSNRLTDDLLNNTTKLFHIDYDANANNRIQNKTDVGTYTYQDGNHKLDNILPGTSQYSPEVHTVTYNNYNRVATVTQGNNIYTFAYDDNAQRVKTEYKVGGTLKYDRYYYNDYEKETDGSGNLIRHLNYVYAPNGLVAIYEQKASSAKMHYVYTDYLGSVRCITDASGNVEQRLSYDPWGRRRNEATAAIYSATEIASLGLLFTRGFTGQEHLDEMGLINLNARMYDPAIGMFISPDNYVSDPSNSQAYNRYSYGLNNPLMFVDRDGNNPILFIGMAMLMTGTMLYGYGETNDNTTMMQVGGMCMLAGSILMGNAIGEGLGAQAIQSYGSGMFAKSMGGNFDATFYRSMATYLAFDAIGAIGEINVRNPNASHHPLGWAIENHNYTINDWLDTYAGLDGGLNFINGSAMTNAVQMASVATSGGGMDDIAEYYASQGIDYRTVLAGDPSAVKMPKAVKSAQDVYNRLYDMKVGETLKGYDISWKLIGLSVNRSSAGFHLDSKIKGNDYCVDNIFTIEKVKGFDGNELIKLNERCPSVGTDITRYIHNDAYIWGNSKYYPVNPFLFGDAISIGNGKW